MNGAAFEQLVCAWLDARHEAELRARLDAALAADPELKPLLTEWERFDTLLRRGFPAPRGIDWAALHRRIAARTTRAGPWPVPHQATFAAPDDARNAALDAVLAGLADVDRRIDWPRLHARIVRAVTGASGERRRGHRRQQWLATAAAGLAAAAAVLLALRPTAGPLPPVRGLVQVVVLPPPAVAGETVEVRLSVAEPTSPPPECLILVDPLAASTPTRGTTDVF
ncbi:MAG: hypothetical protein AB1601_12265 [Planctomycetota bacterium]